MQCIAVIAYNSVSPSHPPQDGVERLVLELKEFTDAYRKTLFCQNIIRIKYVVRKYIGLQI
jgi:hypothetical protein